MKKAKMKLNIFLLLFFYAAIYTYSQDCDDSIFTKIEKNNSAKGTVKIHQSARISRAVKSHIKVNKKINGLNGYRIRIFSENGNRAKKHALQTKARFNKLYSKIDSYMIYDTPNFKIVVGDYRTKTEAEKVRRELIKDFHGAFIIKDIIKFPEID